MAAFFKRQIYLCDWEMCSVVACGRRAAASGVCGLHYLELMRRRRISLARRKRTRELTAWVVGDPGVISAIWPRVDRIVAAEEEIAAARIADRPTTRLIGQLQKGAALWGDGSSSRRTRAWMTTARTCPAGFFSVAHRDR